MSADVDVAWEALRQALVAGRNTITHDLNDHRFIIEAAIRADDLTGWKQAYRRAEAQLAAAREAAEVVFGFIPVASIEPVTQWQRNLEARKEAAIAALRAALAATEGSEG